MPTLIHRQPIAAFIAVFLGTLLSPLLPAQTRPANSNANAYKGPTTTRSYTPLSTMREVATTTGPALQTTTYPAVHVEPISDQLRRDYRLNSFYTKTLDYRGIPIIGSDKVSDYAFLECAFTLDHMLAASSPAVREALLRARVRVGIISVVEYTMDIPENQGYRNTDPQEAAYQDRRSRGLGGIPLATCAEENLLNLRGDPYTAENITIHEFSHTLASAMQRVTPAWYQRLRDTYNQAMSEGLFANSYSATNEQEYWAEGAQAWFDCASQRRDATTHSGIWNRTQLKQYDPRLAQLLAETYGDGPWRYVKTTNQPVRIDGKIFTRTSEQLDHLIGFNRTQFPIFNFNNSPRIIAAMQSNPLNQPRTPATQAGTRPNSR